MISSQRWMFAGVKDESGGEGISGYIYVVKMNYEGNVRRKENDRLLPSCLVEEQVIEAEETMPVFMNEQQHSTASDIRKRV